MTREQTNIGPERDAFVGRDRELRELAAELRDHRLVTILGEGGAGKTRLARHFGASTELFDEVWFCDLVGARDRGDLIGVIAETLDLEVSQSVDVREIGEALDGRGEMLLVLDNLEQIADPAARAVDAWLEIAPEVSFLATSREPLRIQGEIRFQLEPLQTEAGIELFRSRARALGPDFEFETSNAEWVERIVERLEGLPLAIELAASRTKIYSLADLAGELESSFEVLRSDSRMLETRHRTMREAIAWSWELLEERERHLLAEASVFVGGFRLEAARAILLGDGDEPVDELLESLVDKSLVRRVPVEGRLRFELLEPIREFAAEQLDEARRVEVERRHARHFVELIGELERPRIGRDVDDVLAAFWNSVGRDSELAANAALASYKLLRNRGSYPKIHEIVSRALDHPIEDDELAAKLYGVQARCQLHDGHYREGLDVIEEGLERAEASEGGRSEIFLSSLRARTYKALCRPERARRHLEEALALAESVGEPWLEATLRGRMVDIEFDRMDFAAANETLGEVVAFCRTHEIDDIQAHVLTAEARLSLLVGDLERAESSLERAVRAHPGGEEWFLVRHRTELGYLALARGQNGRARDYFDEALELGKGIGNLRRTISTLYGLSLLDRVESEQERVASAGESALLEILELVEGTDDRFQQVQARTRLGVSVLRKPRFAAARELFEEAWERSDDLEHMRTRPHVACWLAAASAATGDLDRAESLLEDASERFEAFEEAEVLAAEVEAFFRPVVEILASEEVPDRGNVERLKKSLRDRSERYADEPRNGVFMWRGWDHRRELAAVLDAAVAEFERTHPEVALRVADDGSRFIAPGGDRGDFENRDALRPILERLAELRDAEPGRGLAVEEIVEIGWPDAVLTDDAAKARVYTAISTLRSAGLGELLVTGPEGYYLDPETPFRWIDA